jgi:hypothetical protein
VKPFCSCTFYYLEQFSYTLLPGFLKFSLGSSDFKSYMMKIFIFFPIQLAKKSHKKNMFRSEYWCHFKENGMIFLFFQSLDDKILGAKFQLLVFFAIQLFKSKLPYFW